MEITLTVSEELATQLHPFQDQLSRILEFGLREWQATAQAGFKGASEVLETLAALPTPEEILALRPSADLQSRIGALLEKNRDTGLTPPEEQEWEQYQYLEHLVRLAKARASAKLAASA